MKKILVCLMQIMLLAPAFSWAQDQKDLPVVIDPANKEQLIPWIDALKLDGINVIVLEASDFSNIKQEKYGCVFVVAHETDQAFPLLQGVFTPEELAKYGTSPNRGMQLKRNPWQDGQRILFFVGSSAAALDDVRKNMRSAWWPHLCTWYDLENTSMHGY